MPKTLDDLREHLFDTLEQLRRKEKPMEIERAKAIADVAQTIINSAKVEVDYVRAVGRDDLKLPVFGAQEETSQQPGGARVTTHRLK